MSWLRRRTNSTTDATTDATADATGATADATTGRATEPSPDPASGLAPDPARHETDPLVTQALEGELNDLLNHGNDLAQRATRANVEWGLGTADRWDLDQETGLLTFTWPDRVATAPFQFLGSYAHRPGTWLWAWANDSLLDAVKAESLRLRDYGLEHGHEILTTEHLHLEAQDADCLALLAIALASTSSFYRGPGELNNTYMTFGDVTVTHASGETTVIRDLRTES